jgi:hypothetical protein
LDIRGDRPKPIPYAGNKVAVGKIPGREKQEGEGCITESGTESSLISLTERIFENVSRFEFRPSRQSIPVFCRTPASFFHLADVM